MVRRKIDESRRLTTYLICYVHSLNACALKVWSSFSRNVGIENGVRKLFSFYPILIILRIDRLKLLVFPNPNLKYWMILFHCVIIPICCRHAYESNVDKNYWHYCNYSVNVTIFIFSSIPQKLMLIYMKSSFALDIFSYLTGFLYHKCFYSYLCIIHKNRAQWFELFHHPTICSYARANGHITLKAPVLVRSPQLSNVESGQYLDGWPPGNTRCCWLFVTGYFSDNSSVFWHFFSS